MSNNFLVLFFFLSFLICCAIGKRDDDDLIYRKTNDMGDNTEAQCFVCKAIVQRIEEQIHSYQLKKKKRPDESQIIQFVEEVCDVDSFRTIPKYSPPQMMAQCDHFIGLRDEEIETVFVKDHPNKERKLCHELTSVCHGFPDDAIVPEHIRDEKRQKRKERQQQEENENKEEL
eukprot:TRINITY_DN2626_c0_g1_i1.p1 TRINITY_DN2626_c0_g1~~TRINITY_DN2626_c0_g1_i1.p1  ORF type:complete len:191 (-),score=80.61 TRINITY_DN2626_c0_g1_i1:145-663(-)